MSGNHNFDIRRPNIDDVAEIVKVHQEAFVWGYENNDEPALGANKDALTKFVNGKFAGRKADYWGAAVLRGTGIYVAHLIPDAGEDSGQIVGIGEGLDDDVEERSIISALYVLPRYQRIGIGAALLDAVLSGLRHNTVRLTVTSWTHAKDFYSRRGFQATTREIPLPREPLSYGINLEQTEMEIKR